MTADLFGYEEREVLNEYRNEQHNPLRREMESILRGTNITDMQMFRSVGIPAPELYAAGLVGAACIEVARNNSWQPVESGRRCIIVPAVEHGIILDLIAFNPGDPDAWCSRVGNAWALGMDDITAARDAWKTLFIHPTPLDWLRSGGRGACVVEWTHEARMCLRDMGEIDVTSPKFAQALRLELARPPRLPEISIKRMRRGAA